jgi:hypothetical protein
MSGTVRWYCMEALPTDTVPLPTPAGATTTIWVDV